MNESSNNTPSNFTPAGLTPFEEAFYLGTGFTGFAFNALVLFIAYMRIDTHDKPRQVSQFFRSDSVIVDSAVFVFYSFTVLYCN